MSVYNPRKRVGSKSGAHYYCGFLHKVGGMCPADMASEKASVVTYDYFYESLRRTAFPYSPPWRIPDL